MFEKEILRWGPDSKTRFSESSDRLVVKYLNWLINSHKLTTDSASKDISYEDYHQTI